MDDDSILEEDQKGIQYLLAGLLCPVDFVYRCLLCIHCQDIHYLVVSVVLTSDDSYIVHTMFSIIVLLSCVPRCIYVYLLQLRWCCVKL